MESFYLSEFKTPSPHIFETELQLQVEDNNDIMLQCLYRLNDIEFVCFVKKCHTKKNDEQFVPSGCT